MKATLLVLLLAFGSIAAGSAVYYLYGYKDSFWIECSGYLLVIGGWIFLVFLLIMWHLEIRTRNETNPHPLRTIGNLLFFVIYPGALVALVAGFVYLEDKKDGRVEHILSTENVHFTTASVVRIEQRRRKHSSHIYAVITYKTAGSEIEQGIKDDGRHYQQGQELKIKYSEKYPDMFALLP